MARDRNRYLAYQRRCSVQRSELNRERRAAEPMSFEEIGRQLGLTGAYVGRLYYSAMRKMKAAVQNEHAQNH